MKELLDRFVELETILSSRRGDFTFFALFLRKDAEGGIGTSGYSGYSPKWDLIVAAPWIEADRREALTVITKELQQIFNPSEITMLSRVVLLEPTNPDIEKITRIVQVRHGCAEVKDISFSGLPIKEAYIITSDLQPLNEPVTV